MQRSSWRQASLPGSGGVRDRWSKRREAPAHLSRTRSTNRHRETRRSLRIPPDLRRGPTEPALVAQRVAHASKVGTQPLELTAAIGAMVPIAAVAGATGLE